MFTKLAVALELRHDKAMSNPCTWTFDAEYQRVTAVEPVKPDGATDAIGSLNDMNDIAKAMSTNGLQGWHLRH